MRVTAFLVIGLLTVALLPNPTSGFAQENDYLIVPGQRVGRWEVGRPIDAYGFGQQVSRWEGTTGGRPYYDGYSFGLPPTGPFLQVYACRSDNLVFGILLVRRLDRNLPPGAEELKYKTAQGIAIGIDEAEVVRLMGRPERTIERTERHGALEIGVGVYEYPGIDVRFNRADRTVFAVGATTHGGFVGCRQAVLGTPPVAQPAPTRVEGQALLQAVGGLFNEA